MCKELVTASQGVVDTETSVAVSVTYHKVSSPRRQCNTANIILVVRSVPFHMPTFSRCPLPNAPTVARQKSGKTLRENQCRV